MSIGPLIDHVIDLDPNIIVSAFVATTAIFVCFSGAAYYGRKWIYIGGFLSSALSLLCLLGFLNLFFHFSFMFWIQLYGGLLVFCGYVLYDTAKMFEKIEKGESKDYVDFAVELFLDFAAIFVRILIILAKNSEKKKKKKDDDD